MSLATPRASSKTPTPRLQRLIHELNQELDQELDQERMRGRTGGPGGQITPANQPRDDHEAPCHASGFEAIDSLIGGGFPMGALSEISGPVSSGRTTLALALLARMTRGGAYVTWVDAADAFDPPSAQAAGVQLERVLWVRAPEPLAALRCAERVLETEGFALVGLDLTRGETRSIPDSAWLRLTRLVASKRNSLIVLSKQRLAGSRAALALEMKPATAHFTGTPALLEALEPEARLARPLRIQRNMQRERARWKGAA